MFPISGKILSTLPAAVPSMDRDLMRQLLLVPLLAAGLHAAVIRGLVVENQSGHPLARALGGAQPITGTAGATQSVRSNEYGAFEFAAMPGGAYLVLASRRSFAPT